MKHSNLFNLLTAALILSLGVMGCHPKSKAPTPIPNGKLRTTGPGPYGPEGGSEKVATVPQGNDINANPNPNPIGGEHPLVPFDINNSIQDRDAFQSYTIHFEFDRATIRASDTASLDAVASFLKGNPSDGVLVEGYCDERGTEQYNLSLGERRALAAREYFINAGIESDRVHTISYGEARPVDAGHNDSAWSKNRRDEFVLLKPKQ